jgi:hypothetical protein
MEVVQGLIMYDGRVSIWEVGVQICGGTHVLKFLREGANASQA